MYYVRHPITKRDLSLETKDKQLAIRRWAVLNARWEMEKNQGSKDEWVDRVITLSQTKATDEQTLLCDYLHYWRTQKLGHRKNEDGSISWGECKIPTLRGKRKGKPVEGATRRDLAVDARQLELTETAKFPLDDPKLNQKIRKLLSGWLDKPRRYNSLRNTLSRVMGTAVEEGVIDRNPITMADIRPAIAEEREVLIPDDAYLAITERLSIHQFFNSTKDGTWRAKVCDMIYLLSQQPIDVFGMKESQGELYDGPVPTDEGLVYGMVRFARHKTAVGVDLAMNEDLANLWRWFQTFKRDQAIISEYLMVYPRYLGMRSRGKPVLHDYIARNWAEAAKEAGYGGQYQLRDLRKKGLTEEYVSQGENDKGGHTTEAMRNHYRLIKPPKRARSTIKDLRSAKVRGTDKAGK